MGYLVLARKWRPQTFKEVAGQDHVTHTLANAIKAGRVAHAYLFTGPRGVGKTTTARILARALNCESGPTPEPCGKCDSCRSITAGSNLDVLEIDGASNRGIDDIRELREQVRYAPSEGRYKVYIVDEVHMLTDQAFNALLKTLEEPPSHVVFVFATTSPQKIPVTILSRCQRFDFSRIPAETIRKRLDAIKKKEKFDIDDAALALLAKKARGSLRDAESLLDQVTSAADGPLDEKAVVALLGVGDSDLFFAMCHHIGKSDAGSALKDMDVAFKSGLDIGEFINGLQEHLRSLFLLAVDPGLEGALDVPVSEVPRYKEQASGFKQKELLKLMEIVSVTAGAMRRSDDPRFHAELALARMADLGTEEGLGDIVRRLEELESRLASGGSVAGGGGRSEGSPKKSRSAAASHRAPAAVEPLPPEKLGELWGEVVKRVTEKKTYLGNFLTVASPVEAGSESLALGFPEECGFHRDRVSENSNRRIIQKAIQGVFGKFLYLRCVTLEDAQMPGAGKGPEIESPKAAAERGGMPEIEAGAKPSWTGGPEVPSELGGAGARTALQSAAGPTLAEIPSPGMVASADSDDPLRRVIEVFEGEIVEGPAAGK